jgi:glutamyl-tRNA reductase
VNHQTAPLAVRERISFNTEGLPLALRDLVDHEPVREAAIISTCNRTELYCNTPEPHKAVRWLAAYHKLKESLLEPYLYTLPRERAVKHAFPRRQRLDSMVLGEPQILGQMKQACARARPRARWDWCCTSCFSNPFSVAKECAATPRSARLGVDGGRGGQDRRAHLSQHLRAEDPVHRRRGDDRAHGHALRRQRPRAATFANRTIERAQELAARFDGSVQSLNDLPDYLAGHDIVVTCTASQLPIIGKGSWKARSRRGGTCPC